MSAYPSKYFELRVEDRECPACLHPRLLHDGWGCVSRCGCLVGIVQMTKNLFAVQRDLGKDREQLELQSQVVAEQDVEGNAKIKNLVGRLLGS